MNANCIICGRELSNKASVIKGIGPICRTKVLSKLKDKSSNVCDYEVEFYNEQKIIVIHEKADPNNPKISLTNCIEYVIRKIISGYQLCPGIWSFVEHANYKQSLFGGYQQYDLVSIDGENLLWRYLWHSDAKNELQPFSKNLVIDRVAAYRNGANAVINKIEEVRP